MSLLRGNFTASDLLEVGHSAPLAEDAHTWLPPFADLRPPPPRWQSRLAAMCPPLTRGSRLLILLTSVSGLGSNSITNEQKEKWIAHAQSLGLCTEAAEALSGSSSPLGGCPVSSRGGYLGPASVFLFLQVVCSDGCPTGTGTPPCVGREPCSPLPPFPGRWQSKAAHISSTKCAVPTSEASGPDHTALREAPSSWLQDLLGAWPTVLGSAVSGFALDGGCETETHVQKCYLDFVNMWRT